MNNTCTQTISAILKCFTHNSMWFSGFWNPYSSILFQLNTWPIGLSSETLLLHPHWGCWTFWAQNQIIWWDFLRPSSNCSSFSCLSNLHLNVFKQHASRYYSLWLHWSLLLLYTIDIDTGWYWLVWIFHRKPRLSLVLFLSLNVCFIHPSLHKETEKTETD